MPRGVYKRSKGNKGWFKKGHLGFGKGLGRDYLIRKPWIKTYQRIRTRCYYDKLSRYYKKIKNFLTLKDLEYLWFRDKAYLMKRPSIDRIDNGGNYILVNCRYLELTANIKRKKTKNQWMN